MQLELVLLKNDQFSSHLDTLVMQLELVLLKNVQFSSHLDMLVMQLELVLLKNVQFSSHLDTLVSKTFISMSQILLFYLKFCLTFEFFQPKFQAFVSFPSLLMLHYWSINFISLNTKFKVSKKRDNVCVCVCNDNGRIRILQLVVSTGSTIREGSTILWKVTLTRYTYFRSIAILAVLNSFKILNLITINLIVKWLKEVCPNPRVLQLLVKYVITMY